MRKIVLVGLICLFVVMFAGSVFAEIKTSIEKNKLVLGEKAQLTIFPGTKGIFQNVMVYSGNRQVGTIRVNDAVFKLEKEKFSPSLEANARFITYAPKQSGNYYFKVYDYATKKYIQVPFSVEAVSYKVASSCSKVITVASRGECDEKLCAKKGMERVGCVKDSTYSREICKLVKKPKCGEICPVDYNLESIEKC